jgi:hypothetical protein
MGKEHSAGRSTALPLPVPRSSATGHYRSLRLKDVLAAAICAGDVCVSVVAVRPRWRQHGRVGQRQVAADATTFVSLGSLKTTRSEAGADNEFEFASPALKSRSSQRRAAVRAGIQVAHPPTILSDRRSQPQTAPFSLCGRACCQGGRPSGCAPWCERGAHFSFGAWCADCSWELSRLLNSMRGRQAARKQRELAETVVGSGEPAGLKGWWRPRMCQLAMSTLRATADLAGFLPARAAIEV